MSSVPPIRSVSYGSVDEAQVKVSILSSDSSAAAAPSAKEAGSRSSTKDAADSATEIDGKSEVVWKRLLEAGGSAEWKNGTIVLRGTLLEYGDKDVHHDRHDRSSTDNASEEARAGKQRPGPKGDDDTKGVALPKKIARPFLDISSGGGTSSDPVKFIRDGVATAGAGISKGTGRARGVVTDARDRIADAMKKNAGTGSSSSPSNEMLNFSSTLDLATLDWDVAVSAESIISSIDSKPNSNGVVPLPPPTPYLISVRVANLKSTSSASVGSGHQVIELQLCFRSLDMQMEWLSALASAVAKASEMAFNAGPGSEASPASPPLRESPVAASAKLTSTTKQKPALLVKWPIVAKLLLSLGFFNIILLCCPLWLTVAMANTIVILIGLYFLGVYSLPLHLFLQTESEVQQEGMPLIGSTTASQNEKQSKVYSEDVKASEEASAQFLESLRSMSLAVKPVAGTTTIRLVEPTDDNTVGGNRFAGWRPIPSSFFQVRAHGYLSTSKKMKVPSPSELYELVDVDVFESPARVPEMATRVRLPDAMSGHDEEGDQSRSWQSPDLFVISFSVPCEAPRIGHAISDGPGYTITMYYRMKAETREVLQRITSQQPLDEDDRQQEITSAVRLFEAWCSKDANDPEYQGRFKVIIDANNLAEIGAPAWISKYNATPFLIKREGVTGFVYKYPHLSCIEFDITLHPFPYLFKQGAAFMKEHYFVKVLASLGFIIEGRNDDELPEVLIGEGMQICYPDPAIAIQAEDLFSGTSPKSK